MGHILRCFAFYHTSHLVLSILLQFYDMKVKGRMSRVGNGTNCFVALLFMCGGNESKKVGGGYGVSDGICYGACDGACYVICDVTLNITFDVICNFI
jgi:hypothetical protein